MTRHDYETIAQTIKGRVENAEAMHLFGYNDRDKTTANDVLTDLVNFMAQELWRDNKAFDKELFYKNCGLK